MRVLGVDPGTVATGWGVVDEDGQNLRFVAGGVIRSRGALADRLQRIYEETVHLLAQFEPGCLSLEKTFVGDNVQSAFRLGEARGAILVAAAQADVVVHEYSPAEIKVAVAGHGRAAKAQVQAMVSRLLGVETPLPGDEADALGAAICLLHTQRFARCVAQQEVGGRRRLRGVTRRGRVASRPSGRAS
jgi:crossover junction endodeoxyribonuclease RuvC